MRNFIQPGNILTFTAPSGGVVSSGGYLIGQTFVVATGDADEGDPFEGQVTGVFELAKNNTLAWAEGQPLYWDDANSEVTTSDADGAVLIGSAAAAALQAATVGNVRLNGTPPAAGLNFAALNQFVSTEQTGTGSAQNVAHGLGVVPAAVLIVPTDTAPATTGAYTAVEGSHTSTNVVVTVTSGKKYKVWAMA